MTPPARLMRGAQVEKIVIERGTGVYVTDGSGRRRLVAVTDLAVDAAGAVTVTLGKALTR